MTRKGKNDERQRLKVNGVANLRIRMGDEVRSIYMYERIVEGWTKRYVILRIPYCGR